VNSNRPYPRPLPGQGHILPFHRWQNVRFNLPILPEPHRTSPHVAETALNNFGSARAYTSGVSHASRTRPTRGSTPSIAGRMGVRFHIISRCQEIDRFIQ
jgi:hypothetical protein